MTIDVRQTTEVGEAAARLVLARDGADRAEARLDPAGWPPTEPDAVALRFRRLDGTSDWPAEELETLAAAAVAAAVTPGPGPGPGPTSTASGEPPSGGAVRVVVGWDPLDAPGQAALGRAGFRPTGRQPYFVLGGGHVEYVMGYADVAGATLDLVAGGGAEAAGGG